MEFGVLGPLAVHDGDREVPIVGAKQRLLLALLLANAGQPVSRDRLAEALWRDGSSGSDHALDLQISRLRKVVGRSCVLTVLGGYRLVPGFLDVDGFETLAGMADVESLRNALALWRGPAFGELRDHPGLSAAAYRLDQRRVEVAERLFDLELAAGRAAGIVDELQRLVIEEPLRDGCTRS